jgi:protein-tyrosine-phosphatase
MHVLFVCSGNTCRSPMAEALFTKQLKNNKDFTGSVPTARSAGIYALDGSPASREATKVMAEMGIDIRDHRAQQLNDDLIQWADLILTMTEAQYRTIINQYGVPAEKVYTLANFSQHKKADVIDPFGSGIEAYRRCAEQIHDMIRGINKKFK